MIIRQDLVIVWSHILAENIPNMMKTLAHTSVNFVVMNIEMVQIWRNTCFNIHLKDVISWNGAQMNILWKCTFTKIILKLLLAQCVILKQKKKIFWIPILLHVKSLIAIIVNQHMLQDIKTHMSIERIVHFGTIRLTSQSRILWRNLHFS